MPAAAISIAGLYAQAFLLRPVPWLLLLAFFALLPLGHALTAFSFDREPLARLDLLLTTLYFAPAVALLTATTGDAASRPSSRFLPLLARLPTPSPLILGAFGGYWLSATLVLLTMAILILPFYPFSLPSAPTLLFSVLLDSCLHLAVLAALVVACATLLGGVASTVAASALYLAGHLAPAVIALSSPSSTPPLVFLLLPFPHFASFVALSPDAGLQTPLFFLLLVVTSLLWSAILLLVASVVLERRLW